MLVRSALAVAAVAGIAIAVGLAAPSQAQTPPAPAGPSAVPAPATPPAPPAAQSAPKGAAGEPHDAFGEDATLTAKPVAYVKGTGKWDSAFETISGALKKVHAYIDKQALKADGLPMTIFTSTDDAGFDYEAAIPIAEPPRSAPRGDIAIGDSPEGRALKFVHRGSYDGLEDTYEAITNYMDEKRLDTKDMIIEEYVTDPALSDGNKLVINVYVFVK